jgi:four helix bundle protein
MPQDPNPKRYDLEERTFQFAKRVRVFVKRLPRTMGNIADVRQLLRSSGSVAANYIEANDALGRKDFIMKIRIARREAKESHLWLRLLDPGPDAVSEQERSALEQECDELMRIFGAILNKSSTRPRFEN